MIRFKRRSRPYRRFSSHVVFFSVVSISFLLSFARIFTTFFDSDPDFWLAMVVNRGLLTILLPIFNKSPYLDRAFRSIYRLSLDRKQLTVICLDDGSSDNSTAIVELWQQSDLRVQLISLPENSGILSARIKLVEFTRTPWLVFLDGDDEFDGEGMVKALTLAIKKDADIVQFGCRLIARSGKKYGCWREPRKARVLTAHDLRYRVIEGIIDIHVHRKVFRTSLVTRAIDAMPQRIKERKMLRWEDILMYVYIILNMTGLYYFIPDVGEFHYDKLPDNSLSIVKQNVTQENVLWDFVNQTLFGLLGHHLDRV
jgi:glycosyltransferase involved in cell wall biosynthesis